MYRLKYCVVFLAVVFAVNVNAQIVVTNTQTPKELVENELIGVGITVSNIMYNSSLSEANSIQAQMGTFNGDSTSFILDEGVIMSTGNIRNAVGPNASGGATDNGGLPTEAYDDYDFSSVAAPTATEDECLIEFDFVSSTNSINLKFVFATEEYHEFSTSSFNDLFCCFISGPGIVGPYTDLGENIALIPDLVLPISVNNLNNGLSNSGPCVNCEYLIDNTDDGLDIEFDGHTVVLAISKEIIAGETYHIKLVIGDVGDSSYDSGVFLKKGSFSSVSCENSFNTIEEITCDLYTVPSGDETYTESGIYTDTLANISGCDSIITIDLTVNHTIAEVINSEGTLIAEPDSAEYQWVECDSTFFITLPSEINQEFTPLSNGEYAVIVNKDGCIDTSSCMSITTTGIMENEGESDILIYPNPVTNEFYIDFGSQNSRSVEIYNLNGQVIYQRDKIDGKVLKLNLNIATGVYIVRISENDLIRYRRFEVE